jgi:DNA mismatch repair protein MutH
MAETAANAIRRRADVSGVHLAELMAALSIAIDLGTDKCWSGIFLTQCPPNVVARLGKKAAFLGCTDRDFAVTLGTE